MSETKNYVICDKSDLVAVGDAVRSLIGSTDAMNLSSMKSNVTTAKSDIDNAFAVLEAKGITVPSGGSVSDIASLIENIEAGAGDRIFGCYFESGQITPADDITSTYTINFEKKFFQR